MDQWTLGQKSSTQMSVVLIAGSWCSRQSTLFPCLPFGTWLYKFYGSSRVFLSSWSITGFASSREIQEQDGGRRVVFLGPWESLPLRRRPQYNLGSPARETKPTREWNRRCHSWGHCILSPPDGKEPWPRQGQNLERGISLFPTRKL